MLNKRERDNRTQTISKAWKAYYDVFHANELSEKHALELNQAFITGAKVIFVSIISMSKGKNDEEIRSLFLWPTS